MNIQSAVLLTGLILLIGFVIYYLIRRKLQGKNGCCGCCGDCTNCGYRESSEQKKH